MSNAIQGSHTDVKRIFCEIQLEIDSVWLRSVKIILAELILRLSIMILNSIKGRGANSPGALIFFSVEPGALLLGCMEP